MKRFPLVLLLLLSASAYAQTQSDVQFDFTVDHAAADEAAGTIPARATITNNAAVPLEQIEILLNYGTAEPVVTDPSWTCQIWSEQLRTISCRHAAVPAQSQLTLDFAIRYPLRAGRHLQGAALVAHYMPANRFSIHRQIFTVMFLRFVVSNTNDSGPGSLRDAITAMNGHQICIGHPCRVTFDMDGQTINLLSPLPRITLWDVEVDGTTQPDTNPLGPDVEILGAGLREGNGLELDSRVAAIRGLAIGYFPGNGIVHFPRLNEWHSIVIEKNYIGLDATGSLPRINLGRGIVLNPGYVSATISNNVISGNHRSGIFVDTVRSPGFSLSKVIRITNNRIGVDPRGEWPIPNGASGIFIGPRADQVLVENNVIAHNKHFGVSVSREAVYVSVLRNRMFANALFGVDIALDGPTPVLSNGFNSVPTLLTARYDAATNTTTITGRGSGPGTGSFRTFRYELYASNSVDAEGYAETEQVLGIAVPADNGAFSLTAPGDLRGKYISAVGIRYSNLDGSILEDTSEISRAIRAE